MIYHVFQRKKTHLSVNKSRFIGAVCKNVHSKNLKFSPKARSHKASRRCGCSSATKDAGSHGSPMDAMVEVESEGRYNGSKERTLGENYKKKTYGNSRDFFLRSNLYIYMYT